MAENKITNRKKLEIIIINLGQDAVNSDQMYPTALINGKI